MKLLEKRTTSLRSTQKFTVSTAAKRIRENRLCLAGAENRFLQCIRIPLLCYVPLSLPQWEIQVVSVDFYGLSRRNRVGSADFATRTLSNIDGTFCDASLLSSISRQPIDHFWNDCVRLCLRNRSRSNIPRTWENTAASERSVEPVVPFPAVMKGCLPKGMIAPVPSKILGGLSAV